MLERIFQMYAEHGKSLRNLHFNEAVLPADVLKSHFFLFENENITILGGDIYILDKNGEMTFTYDGWSFDENDVSKSISYALNYINSINLEKFYVSLSVQYCEERHDVANKLTPKWIP